MTLDHPHGCRGYGADDGFDSRPATMTRTTIQMELTREELLHIHACLTAAKNEATRDGRIWRNHEINANARTHIEIALT